MTFFKFLFTKTFLKQLLIAGVVLVVLVFLMMWWLRISTNHNEKIEVPNLSELTLDKVETKLNELKLRYEILDSANYNPDFPRFSVIEQIPEAGKYVKVNRKLYLTLNPSGYRDIEVPDVLGKTRRQAEPTLLAMGFEIGKISYKPHISDNVLEMRHNGQILHPGDAIPKTSKIDLIVGDESLNRLKSQDDDEDDAENNTNLESELHDGF